MKSERIERGDSAASENNAGDTPTSYAELGRQILINQDFADSYYGLDAKKQIALLGAVDRLNYIDYSENPDYLPWDPYFIGSIYSKLANLDDAKLSPLVRLIYKRTVAGGSNQLKSLREVGLGYDQMGKWTNASENPEFFNELSDAVNKATSYRNELGIPEDENILTKSTPTIDTYEWTYLTPPSNEIAPGVARGSSLTNDFGVSSDSAYLVKVCHSGVVEKAISDEMGVDLSKISLVAQVQLLKFMAEAGDMRFDSLCSTLHKVKPKLRLKLAESFLAVDFGEDFGDALLDIADSERISDEQLGEILDGVSSCRESIKGITGLYKDFDGGEFTQEYARATNERLTDAIMVFREIAKKGEAKAVLNTWRDSKTGDVAEQRKAKFNFEEAIEALNYEAKSLAIINGAFGDVIEGKTGAFAEKILAPEEGHRRSMYNLYSPDYGYVLLYVRPEGSSQFEPSIEYGKFRSRYDEKSHNVGTEASISMITNPVDPFSLPNPFRPDRRAVRNPNFYDPATMDKVSAIRLDREGRTPDMEASDGARSPVNRAGVISVDLAAINDREDTPSGKIARLISVGNRLRADFRGTDFTLNHNTRWFEQEKYGTEDGFARLADYVDTMANGLCEIRPPVDGESFTRLRKESRSRKLGKKALGKVA